MYKTRLKRLMYHMQTELYVDVALIISPINIYYYSGFYSNPHERFFVLAVDAKKETTTLFLPSLDENAAKNVAEVDAYIPISDTDNSYEIFQSNITNVHSFAFEKSYVTVMQHERFATSYPEASFTNIESYIDSERLIKFASEVEYVRKAMQITEKGLENTLKKVSVHMTELEIKAELEYQLAVLGSEGLAFDTIVLSGGKSALPHGTPGQREIQYGDFLLFDFGVRINGYCSDVTRTFIVGEGSEKQKDIYETVLAANEKAIEQVSVGEPLKNVDRTARDIITSRNYGEHFTHRIGHGLGLEAHEEPSIHSENENLVEKGMLFTIEPGIYVPDVGGVRIEDNIYVNKAGETEVLSSFPKTLIDILV